MSSAGQNAPQSPQASGADPSMEDILASIRRILNEEEPARPDDAPAEPAASEPVQPAQPIQAVQPAQPPETDDVLLLDPSMMVTPPDEEPAPVPEEPQSGPPVLMGPETARAAAASVADLVRKLALERTTQTHSGGPTIEDLVRAELRPILKEWLDTHLPPLVERLVQAEIERVVGRAAL
jgi:cell pole-organizing protein PopZ